MAQAELLRHGVGGFVLGGGVTRPGHLVYLEWVKSDWRSPGLPPVLFPMG